MPLVKISGTGACHTYAAASGAGAPTLSSSGANGVFGSGTSWQAYQRTSSGYQWMSCGSDILKPSDSDINAALLALGTSFLKIVNDSPGYGSKYVYTAGATWDAATEPATIYQCADSFSTDPSAYTASYRASTHSGIDCFYAGDSHPIIYGSLHASFGSGGGWVYALVP